MEKKNISLQEELAKRKFKRPNRLYNWFYHLVMADFKLKSHNPEINYIDDIRKEKGPAFIIWNHLSRLDHAYVSKATYPLRFSMVAAYNEFFRSHLHTVFKMMNILPKKNFCVDATGVKGILSIIKQGGIVSLAPEGLATLTGYNERILPGIGKLLKHCKVPVYCFDFKGQAISAPVYSNTYRKGGKTVVNVHKLFTAEDVEKLSAEEIEEKIQDCFIHDDYDWQIQNHYKWDTKGVGCEGLEDICYKCPDCKEEFSMQGKGDDLVCKKCGFSVHMNEYIELIPNRKIKNLPVSPSSWALWERGLIIKEIRENPDYKFSCHVKFGMQPTDHLVKGKDRSTEIVGEGEFVLDHKGMHYNGTKNGEPYNITLDYKQYFRLIEPIDTRSFSIYINDEYAEFFPSDRVVIKMDFIVAEMHRLHYNIWKPVKSHEYLYKDYEK